MFVVPEIIATVFGWIGALCAVSAYGAVTTKHITADSATFQGLNLFGAALLSVSASAHEAWPSAIVNVVWVGIGIIALRAIFRARRAALLEAFDATRNATEAEAATVAPQASEALVVPDFLQTPVVDTSLTRDEVAIAA